MSGLEAKARNLILTHHTRQILQVFINTFLGMYFLKITDGNVLKVVLYYVIFYLGHNIFYYLIYKYVKLPDILSYRLSLFMKLLDCLVLLVLGRNIVKIIYLFAVMEAIAQSLYYTSYKTMTVANNRGNAFKQYFSTCRIFEGIINFIVPASLGVLISEIGYSYIFVILSIVMMISFLMSFKVEASAKFNKTFNLKEFFKNMKDKKTYSSICLNSLCYGITDGGTTSLLLSLIIYTNYSGESTLGYLTSAVALTSIFLSQFHKTKINSKNFLITYLPTVILTIIIAFPVGMFTKIIFLIIYRFMNESIKVATCIEHDQTTYSFLPKVSDKKYQREYLYFIEFMLNVGRMLGMMLISLTFIVTKDVKYLSYLFIVCTIFYLVYILNLDKLLKKQSNEINVDSNIVIQK